MTKSYTAEVSLLCVESKMRRSPFLTNSIRITVAAKTAGLSEPMFGLRRWLCQRLLLLQAHPSLLFGLPIRPLLLRTPPSSTVRLNCAASIRVSIASSTAQKLSCCRLAEWVLSARLFIYLPARVRLSASKL